MLRYGLMIVAPQVFRDEEYLEPKLVLEDGGLLMRTASNQLGPVFSKDGMRVISERTLADADATEYEVIVFVGGAGAEVFFDDPDAHAFAKGVHEAGKVVGAICIAPSILANAGMLEGKTATAFESQKENLVAGGADYTGAPVEVDDRIVTANGPEAATAFGEAMLKLVDEITPAE